MKMPAVALVMHAPASVLATAGRDRPATGLAGGNGEPAVPTSEELAARSATGDGEAFAALVERHTDRLFNLLFQWVGNGHDAEDLVQETFLRAYRNLGRYQPARPFLPWLFTIARRAASSHWRKVRPTEELDSAADEADPGADPSAHAMAEERVASVWRMARRLRPKQYRALWLRYGEGFEIGEVAQVLGTNSIHVKVLLHRARTELTRMLHGSVRERKVGL
jgi:RNA polymerase sigma-70 factor (ECF subfamily)